MAVRIVRRWFEVRSGAGRGNNRPGGDRYDVKRLHEAANKGGTT